MNDTAAALCAVLALSAPVAGAWAATGPQHVELPAQQNPYPVEAVGGLGETGDPAYVFSTRADVDPEENQVLVDGRTIISGGGGQATGGDGIQGSGLSLTNDGIVRGGGVLGPTGVAVAGGAGVSGARLILTNNEILQGGAGSAGNAGSAGSAGRPLADDSRVYDSFYNAVHGGSGYAGGDGGTAIRGSGLRILNASDATIEGGGGGKGGAGGAGPAVVINYWSGVMRYTKGGAGGDGGMGGDAISGADLIITNGGDIVKGTGGAGGSGGLGGSGEHEMQWERFPTVLAADGAAGADGAAIRLTGGVNFLTLEAGSSIDGDIVLSHDDKAFGAPQLSVLNRGGASARVTGDVIVGAGADAGFAGSPLTLRGDLTLQDGSTLSVAAAAAARAGEPSETVRARGVTIGANATFNLSGISAASATDVALFSVTEGKIAGDFADIAIGGKIADRDAADADLRSANYLSLLRTRKSDDGTGYLATYQLGWFDTQPKAHGGFLLGEGETFTVGTALTPVSASGGWDGNSLTKQGAGTLILTGDNTYSGLTTVEAGTLRVGHNGDTGSVAGDIVNQGHVIFDRSNALTYAGVISGGGRLTLAGSGALTLTGANTYTGITTLEAGTLITGADDALAHSAGLTLARGAVLDLAGHAQTLADGATLKSRGVIRTGGADLRGSDLAITASGRIEAGDGALAFTGGANSLTLERDAAMSGGVTLSAGADAEHPVSLRILSHVATTVAGALTAGAHTGLTLDGAPLTFTGAAAFGEDHALAFAPGLSLTAKSVSFGAGSTVSARIKDWDQRPVRLITTTDAAGLTGPWRSGQVLLEGAPTPPHAYLSADGRNLQYSLRWDGLDDAASGTFRVAGGQELEVAVALADNTAQTNSAWDGKRLTKQGGGTLILSADNVYSGGTRIEDGTLQLGKGGASGSVTGDIVNDAALVFDHTGPVVYGGAISGSGSVTKKGADALTLTGANTYTGKTFIEAGTLRIGDGGTAGAMAGSIVNQGALIFDRRDSLTYAGKISGAGDVTQAGSGATFLTGTNTYGGATAIQAGTLQFGAQDAKPSLNALTGSVSVAKDATLAVHPSSLLRVGGEITLSDGSTLLLRHDTLSGDAATTGLTAGKVTIGRDVTLRLPNLADTSPGSKVVFSTTDGIVGDFAGIVMDAPHTADYRDYRTLEVRKSADNKSYLTNYGLSWYASAALAHGTFTLDAGQDDTISQALTQQRWAGTALTKKGAGVLTLTGANTYTGQTSVEGGTLRLGDGGVTGSVAGPVSLAENAALVFDRSDAVAYAGVISGAGTVTKKGTNTLTLLGNSTAYRGVTTIEGGQLVVGGGYDGMLTGDIVNEGSLAFRHQFQWWVGTYGDAISGSGSLHHDGGRLVLTGDNTYTGGTRIANANYSVLQIGDNGTTGSVLGDIDISSLGSVSFMRNDDVTYAGRISGAGSMTKGEGSKGTGMLTLTGDHTYTGGTTIGAGTLRLGDGGVSGSVAGPIFNNAALVFDRSDDLTFPGLISGTGAVTKQGANTLTLTANNDHTGGTTIAAGTLRLGDGGATGSVTGAIVNNAALVFDRSDAATYGGEISGIGSVTKNGAGVLTLSGANTYGGDTTVAAGTLKFGNGTAAANTLGGGLTVAGGTTLDIHAPASVSLTGAALLQDGAAVRLRETLRGNATSTPAAASLAAGKVTIGKDVALTLSGIGHQVQHDVPLFSADGGIEGEFARLVSDGYERPVDYLTLTARKSADQTRYVADYDLTWLDDSGRAHGMFTIAGGLTDTIVAGLQDVAANAATGWDGRSLTKQGTGTLILTGENTYTGGTTVTAGALQIGDKGAKGSVTGDIDIARGSSLSFVRNDDVTHRGAISGAGTVYKGQGKAQGSQGTGILTLTGANTYTGGTYIYRGTLRLGDGGVTGSVTGNILNEAALVFDRSDAVTFDGAIFGSGAVSSRGAGVLTLTGANAYTGLTTVEGGTLRLGDGGVTGSVAGPISLAENAALVFDRSDAVAHAGVISGAGTVTKKGTNTLTLLGNSTAYRGVTTIEGGQLVVGGGYDGMLTGDIVNEGSLAFRHQFQWWVGTYGDAISGSGSLHHDGGRLILTGENTYTGGTTVTSGSVLQIGDNGTTGSVAGDIDTANGGLLSFMRNDDVTYDGVISGAGTVVKGEAGRGTGMLTLTGDNTYSGGTVIRGGTLRLGDGGTTGSVAGYIYFEANNAALVFDRSDDIIHAGRISGAAGAVTKKGSNTLTLTGDNAYAGLTTIAAGTLRLGDGGATGSVTGDIVNNGALVFDRGDAATYAGVISGAGAVAKNGAGELTLTGANAYSGDTTVAAGTLKFGNGKPVANTLGGLTVAGGAALDIHAPASVGLTGAALLQDGSALRLRETLRGNTASASLTAAGKVTLGKDVALTLSGIAHQVQHDVPLFSADGGIEGEFARLVSDGYERPVDYLTLTARKSADQTRYVADYDLTWLDDSGRAHGMFTIADGLTDTIVAGLQDVAANAATGWDGRSLTKQGAGALILTGENAYSGGTTIAAGTLQIGDGGTRGAVTGAIDNQGALVFDRSDDIIHAGRISGAGAVTKKGSNTLTLTGDNAYTGLTTIAGGALRVGAGGASGALAGDIAFTGAGDLIFDRSDASQYAGAITGAARLAKNGAGTLILSGDNLHTGGTRITGGTLQLGDGGATGSVTGDIVNNGALVFDRGDAATYAGVISGAGAVAKNGAGELTLTGANAYNGDTTVAAGTLKFGNGKPVANTLGGLTVAGGAALDIHAPASVSLTGAALLQDGSALRLRETLRGNTASASLTAAGKVTLGKDVALTLSGIAHQVQHDVPLFSADGGIEGEFARLVSDGYERPVDYLTLTARKSADQTRYVADYDLTWLDDSGRAHGMFTIADGLTDTIVAGLQDVAANAATGWDGRSLTKQGAGALILTGENAYSGGTTIAAGTLQIGDGGTRGAVTGAIDNQGALVFDRSDDIIHAGRISGAGSVTKKGSNTLTLTGDNAYTGLTTIAGGALRVGAGGASGALAGDIAFTGAGDLIFDRSDASQYAGAITGAARLAKNGAGTLILSGDNLHTGGTRITGGTLQLGDGGATGSVTGDIVNNGALVFDRGDAATYGGMIYGAGAVAKNGAGELTLTGANAYNGDTTVAAGTLKFGDGKQAANTLGGGLSVAGAATLGIHAPAVVNLAGTATFEDGSALSMRDPLRSGAPFGNMTAAKMVIGKNVTLDLSGIADRPNQSKVLFSADGGIEGDFARLVSDGYERPVDYLMLTAKKSADQKRYLANYGLSWLVDNGQAHGTFTIGDGQQDTVAMTLMNVKPVNKWDGRSLTKQGTGTLILTGDHIYTGDTTIAAGTLALGDGGATGSVRGNIVNRGALVLNRSDDITLPGTISGSGTVTKKGSNTLTLTGDNAYTGLTTIEGGALRVGTGGASGALAGDIAFTGAGDLIFDRSDASQYAGAISGAARLAKNGAGTLILSGDNAHTGGTLISGGTLQLGDGGVTGSVKGDIVNNGVLAFNRSDNVTYGNLISGTGSLIKRGSNTLTLTRANTYSGDTLIEAGTLKTGVADAFAKASGLTIASGARLNLGGFNQTIAQLDNRGVILFNDLGAPAKLGGLTVTGSMKHSGMLVLNTCADCAGQVLTLSGDWVGDGGTLGFGVVLGGDDSKADRLVIGGAASGTTYVAVTNEGGSGAQTVEGIELIRTAGSTDDAFVQQDRIVAGAYEYHLQKGSATGNNENVWYLTSLIALPEIPQVDPVPDVPDNPAPPAGDGEAAPDVGDTTKPGGDVPATGDAPVTGAVTGGDVAKPDAGDTTKPGGDIPATGDVPVTGGGTGGDVAKPDAGDTTKPGGDVPVTGTTPDVGGGTAGDAAKPDAGDTTKPGGDVPATGDAPVTGGGTGGDAAKPDIGDTSKPGADVPVTGDAPVTGGVAGGDAAKPEVGDTTKPGGDIPATGDAPVTGGVTGGDVAKPNAGDTTKPEGDVPATGDTPVTGGGTTGDAAKPDVGDTVKPGGDVPATGDVPVTGGGTAGDVAKPDASDTPKPEGDMPATGGAPAAGGGSPGAVHVYRPEIGSYATNLAAASTLFNTSLSDRESAESVDPVTGARSQTWARAAGGRSHGKMADGQNGYVADRSVLQLGGSVAGGSFSGTDAWRLGVMGGYGSQRSKTRSALSDYQSRGDVAGYSAGLYGSWRQDAQTRSGLYVDGWALYNRFDNTVKGDGLAKETYKSQGITASVESGFLFEVDSYTTDGGRENRFYIRPQAQVLWSGVKADGHTERGGTKVQGVGGNNVQTRLGARFSLVSSPASQRVGGAEGFLEVNWLHTPKAYGVTMDDTQALIQGSKNVVELKAGVEGNLSERLSVSANVTRQQGSQGFQDTQGSLNVKLRF